MPTLKVFRTPIGFHDAYIAAPSQKAALEAWGADSNLFARGVAERVSDPDLTKEPLSRPGIVIRRARGTTADHIAALPRDPPSAKTDRAVREKPEPPSKRPAKPRPRPSRNALDAAEQALADAELRHRDAREALRLERARLDREQRALDRSQTDETNTLERRIANARSRYDRAMAKWRD